MKFDQQTLEIHALAHLVKNPKAMDKFLARGIKEDHFSYIEENQKTYYTKEDYLADKADNIRKYGKEA